MDYTSLLRNNDFTRSRLGATIVFGGDDYTIDPEIVNKFLEDFQVEVDGANESDSDVTALKSLDAIEVTSALTILPDSDDEPPVKHKRKKVVKCTVVSDQDDQPDLVDTAETVTPINIVKDFEGKSDDSDTDKEDDSSSDSDKDDSDNDDSSSDSDKNDSSSESDTDKDDDSDSDKSTVGANEPDLFMDINHLVDAYESQ
jgi:hypothetical protein